MSLNDAMAFIRQKRPEVAPIPAFMSQLQEYEQMCIELGVVHDSKRKHENSGGDKKSAKRRIGPAMGPPQRVIGPSLLPSVDAKLQGEEVGTSEKHQEDATIYGPQLSATDGAVVANGDNRTGDQTTREVPKRDVLKSQEYEQKCIELGVIHDSKRKHENSGDDKTPAKRRIGPAMGPPQRVIGLSMPPSVDAKPQGADVVTSEKHQEDATICGPQLPGIDGTVIANGSNRMGGQTTREVPKRGERKSPATGSTVASQQED